MMTGRSIKAVVVSMGIALEKVSDDCSVLDAALELAPIATNGPVAVELVKVVDETDRIDINTGLAIEAAVWSLF